MSNDWDKRIMDVELETWQGAVEDHQRNLRHAAPLDEPYHKNLMEKAQAVIQAIEAYRLAVDLPDIALGLHRRLHAPSIDAPDATIQADWIVTGEINLGTAELRLEPAKLKEEPK